ncbi:hypothetical protein HYV81_05425 [Candidatus Woesearchaeota archaeon]|nr:hypothetical protein [Candidatus Woesearchaeota archaeon]
MSEIKKTYASLASRYKLPDFEALDKAFEIITLEHDEFLLREIRRKIADRLEFYTHIIESIMQPDTASVSHMHEYRFFDEPKKKAMFSLFRELMGYHRWSLKLESRLGDKDDAAFINDIWHKWEQYRKEMEGICEQMELSWKAEADAAEDLEYLG